MLFDYHFHRHYQERSSVPSVPKYIYSLFVRTCFIIHFPKQNVLKRSSCRTNHDLGVGDPTDNLYSFGPCFLYCCPSAIGSGPYFVSDSQVHCFQSRLKIECLGTLYKCCTSCAFNASSQSDVHLLALQVTLQLDGPQAMRILNRASQKWPKQSCQRRLFAAGRLTCSRCSISF